MIESKRQFSDLFTAMSSPDHPSNATFVALLTKHQPDLWAYVITLMPGNTDAADVLQEVNLVLWTKQKNFEIGTNFRAWAFSVARFEVLAYFKKRKREGIVLLDEELLDLIAEEAPSAIGASDLRLEALESCLRKLRPQDRDLLNHRYRCDRGLDEFAMQLGRSVSALSVSLHRLRSALKDCVRKRMLEREAAP
jgi:RNA polymerase sigma-70 factor (ECF subfamily)